MPDCTAVRSVDRPLTEIWPFVETMDNWAPMLTGYETHEVQSETDSVWTLKGDLGPFSKTVKLAVHITEWTEPNRVAFTLSGVDEAVTGAGSFELSEEGEPVLLPRTWWQQLWDWVLRRPPAFAPPARAHVTFRFQVDAQGPMGPMINALLGPYAEQVANDLLVRVGDHLESTAQKEAA